MSDATTGGDMQSAQCEDAPWSWGAEMVATPCGRVEISKSMSCTPYVHGPYSEKKGQDALLDGPYELRRMDTAAL